MSELFADRYLITSEIGKGRVSTVYLATDTTTRKQVAIKIFNADFVPGNKSLAYLDEEFKKRLVVNHPNIVSIYEKGFQTVNGRTTIFLVLEYLEHSTLAERISKFQEKPYNLKDIINFLLQITDALSKLHSHNICISELNPKRILLKDNNTIKLSPFGFVSATQWICDLSAVSKATNIDYRYLAPETIKPYGIASGTAETDCYLLGILAFELGCGTLPFDANKETIIQFHQTEPVPNTLLNCKLPNWYNEFVQKCMEKDPKDRHSLTEIKELLQDKLSNNENELETIPTHVYKSGIKILFVEDNKLDQLSLARFAKQESYPFTYEIANSVRKARELLENKNFDVVVSGFMLPDGTALDIIKLASDLPTIVITGAGKEDVIAKVLKEGAYDCLEKNINHKHLKDLPLFVMRAYKYTKAINERNMLLAHIQDLNNSLALSLIQNEEACKNLEKPNELLICLKNQEEILKKIQLLVRVGEIDKSSEIEELVETQLDLA